jgi:hypothetical protein
MRKIPLPSSLASNVLISDDEKTLASREWFYDTLAMETPYVVDRLDAWCRSEFCQTVEARLFFGAPEEWSHIEPIGPCVAAWARFHHFDAPWVIRDAIEALLDAADVHGPSGGQLRLVPHGISRRPWDMGAPTADSGSITLGFAWNFASMPRALFTSKMLPALKRRLETEFEAELDRIEQEAAAAGASRPRAKRKDKRQHFRWLIRHQLHGESFEDIATSEGRARQTVSEAVKGTAKSIDLLLRPRDPGGRPHKDLSGY